MSPTWDNTEWEDGKVKAWKESKRGWQPIETAPTKQYILIARPSEYVTTPWEYITAINNPGYKGWTDVGNERLSDSGPKPLWWRPLPEPPPRPT
jgi:hypothetical protein